MPIKHDFNAHLNIINVKKAKQDMNQILRKLIGFYKAKINGGHINTFY